MHANPLNAYQSVEQATLSGRDLEALVLTKAATRLQEARSQWGKTGHDSRLDEALKYNQRLWTFFQVEVSAEENPLPIEIKRNILTLSRFVDKRIFEIMAYPAAEKLDILISINQNIAAGLRMGGQQNAEQAEPVTT
jgi:flagellar protein FlaF